MAVSLIRNAGMAIGWHKDGHRHLPDADIAFENGSITFVGRNYAGPADAVMVTPRSRRAGQRRPGRWREAR